MATRKKQTAKKVTEKSASSKKPTDRMAKARAARKIGADRKNQGRNLVQEVRKSFRQAITLMEEDKRNGKGISFTDMIHQHLSDPATFLPTLAVMSRYMPKDISLEGDVEVRTYTDVLRQLGSGAPLGISRGNGTNGSGGVTVEGESTELRN